MNKKPFIIYRNIYIYSYKQAFIYIYICIDIYCQLLKYQSFCTYLISWMIQFISWNSPVFVSLSFHSSFLWNFWNGFVFFWQGVLQNILLLLATTFDYLRRVNQWLPDIRIHEFVNSNELCYDCYEMSSNQCISVNVSH